MPHRSLKSPQQLRQLLTSLTHKSTTWARRVARRERLPADLTGMCARASAHLFRSLKRKGLSSKIAYSHTHVHVRCAGYLLDPTAEQFISGPHRGPRIVTARRERLRGTIWEASKIFTDLKSLRGETAFWPSEQRID